MATISPLLRELPGLFTETAAASVGEPSAAAHILSTLRRTSQHGTPPRLVAVSKKQPVDKVKWAYHQGVRHFGENYVQELHSKATHLQKLSGYLDLKWHFIGHLQSNKAKLLMNVPGLWMVETVSSCKAASTLNKHWGLRGDVDYLLKVLLQLNTSREEHKTGCTCSTEECLELAQFIHEDCDNLEFCGLMTIGRSNHLPERDSPNPDFKALVDCCKTLESALNLKRPLELSMGMSADYEHAVDMGSTNVRIGTAVFGPREN